MKKFIAVILSITMLFSLAGCAKTNESSEPNYTSLSVESSVLIGAEEIENSFSDEEFNLAKNQSEILSDHLVSSIYFPYSATKKPITSNEINNFVMNTYKYMDTLDYCYQNFYRRELSFPDRQNDPDYADTYQFYFPGDNVKQMVFEIFGIEDWILEGGDIDLNKATNEYETGLEFGFGMMTKTKNFSVVVDEKTGVIETSFFMSHYWAKVEGNPDPVWSEYEEYTITFQMIREDDRVFLRLIEYKKN